MSSRETKFNGIAYSDEKSAFLELNGRLNRRRCGFERTKDDLSGSFA
jgi:hypothetical protein